MPAAAPSDYRFAPGVTARLLGAALVLLALVVLVVTVLVALADLPLDVLVVVAAVGLLVVLNLGWWLRRLAVVRLDEAGYRVRWVRGAGVKHATWKQVQEAVTASPRGIPCVVLRLADGGRTTIPVEVLDVDREQFVRDLQEHLRRGEGLRPFS